jgi:hypothetical protein
LHRGELRRTADLCRNCVPEALPGHRASLAWGTHAPQPAALATRRILVSAEVTQDGLNTSLQHGLDIVERGRPRSHCLYQVKRYKELTDRKIREAVAEYAGLPRMVRSTAINESSIPDALCS